MSLIWENNSFAFLSFVVAHFDNTFTLKMLPYFVDTMTTLLLSIITLMIPINSCHYCSSEVTNETKNNFGTKFMLFHHEQVTHLVEIIERYTFWTSNTKLYQIKCELLRQIKNFPIKVSVKGFLIMDRRLLIVV